MLDHPLSISIAGLSRDPSRPWSGSPKRAIGWVAGLGARCIQLDGAAPGLRPRDLDRSARRDLGASLGRAELTLSGVDLWIPAAHFTDPAHQSRAVDAVLGAIDLTADLASHGRAPRAHVSLHLDAKTPDDVVQTLGARAERAGVGIADHACPPRAATIGIGVDPATALIAGADPTTLALEAGERLVAARLSDADQAGRVVHGRGRLDIDAYVASLAATSFDGPLVVDLRGLGDEQGRAARSAVDRFR